MAQGTFPTPAQCPDCVVNGVAYFVGNPPCIEDLARVVVTPLLEYERFSKVLDVKSGRYLSSQTDYAPQDLIRQVNVQGETDLTHKEIHKHLQDELKSGRNDLPWWEVLVVQNEGPGLSAIVLRFQHSIADGLGLVTALGSIWTAADGSPISSMHDRLSSASRPKINFFRKIWLVLSATAHVVTLGMSRYDDDTVFSQCNHGKMVRSNENAVVLLPQIPLNLVKRIKTAAGVTVNDVLLAAISQAVHDYCKSNNDDVLKSRGQNIQCRALIPVGFPRTKTELEAGRLMRNKWCMMSCDVALGHDNVMDRLEQIRENTQERKSKPYALVQLWFQNNVLRYFPRSIAQKFALDAFSRHSLVVTNVPGPSEVCMIAGRPVENVHIFVSNLVTQVDLVSYNGMVQGNIVYDPASLGSMERFAENYTKAFSDMAEALHIDVSSDLAVVE